MPCLEGEHCVFPRTCWEQQNVKNKINAMRMCCFGGWHRQVRGELRTVSALTVCFLACTEHLGAHERGCPCPCMALWTLCRYLTAVCGQQRHQTVSMTAPSRSCSSSASLSSGIFMDPEAVQMPGILMHWMEYSEGLSSILNNDLGKRRRECLCHYLAASKLSARCSDWTSLCSHSLRALQVLWEMLC